MYGSPVYERLELLTEAAQAVVNAGQTTGTVGEWVGAVALAIEGLRQELARD